MPLVSLCLIFACIYAPESLEVLDFRKLPVCSERTCVFVCVYVFLLSRCLVPSPLSLLPLPPLSASLLSLRQSRTFALSCSVVRTCPLYYTLSLSSLFLYFCVYEIMTANTHTYTLTHTNSHSHLHTHTHTHTNKHAHAHTHTHTHTHTQTHKHTTWGKCECLTST